MQKKNLIICALSISWKKQDVGCQFLQVWYECFISAIQYVHSLCKGMVCCVCSSKNLSFSLIFSSKLFFPSFCTIHVFITTSCSPGSTSTCTQFSHLTCAASEVSSVYAALCWSCPISLLEQWCLFQVCLRSACRLCLALPLSSGQHWTYACAARIMGHLGRKASAQTSTNVRENRFGCKTWICNPLGDFQNVSIVPSSPSPYLGEFLPSIRMSKITLDRSPKQRSALIYDSSILKSLAGVCA